MGFATGERVAVLDVVAEQEVPADEKQGESTLATRDERSREAGEAVDRGQEAKRMDDCEPWTATRPSTGAS